MDGERVELEQRGKHQVEGDLGYTNEQVINNDDDTNNKQDLLKKVGVLFL